MNKRIVYSIMNLRSVVRKMVFCRKYSEKYIMINNSGISKTRSRINIDGCRALEIDKNNIAECLNTGPNSCSFALPFGYCFLCQHPRLNEILDNTKKISLKESAR